MIARCLDEKLEFGMMLAADKAVAAVGCTAEDRPKDAGLSRRAHGHSDRRARPYSGCARCSTNRNITRAASNMWRTMPRSIDPDQETRTGSSYFEQCHALLFGQAMDG